MKICFLGDAASIHIRRWCEYFRDNKHQVSIISFNKAEIDGVEVRFVGENINIKSEGGNSNYLKNIFKIKKIIKEINPDIINAHYLTSYGLIATLSKVKPLVVSTWGSDILVTPKKNIVYRTMTKYVIKKCNLLTSDSKFMSEEIIKLGANQNKVITVPMGINKSIVDNEKRDRAKRFLSMRTLCANSNIDIILKAFSNIVDEDSEAKLIITNSGDLKEEVLNLISDLSLEKNIDFKGFINHDEVINLLKTCSIYLSIPTSDSTSVTLLEGMACGIFPIVSDLPANKEWIEDKVNGYILKENNEDELYKLMKEALNNVNIRETSIKINKDIISNRAIWDDNMSFVEKEYLKIINKY